MLLLCVSIFFRFVIFILSYLPGSWKSANWTSSNSSSNSTAHTHTTGANFLWFYFVNAFLCFYFHDSVRFFLLLWVPTYHHRRHPSRNNNFDICLNGMYSISIGVLIVRQHNPPIDNTLTHTNRAETPNQWRILLFHINKVSQPRRKIIIIIEQSHL